MELRRQGRCQMEFGNEERITVFAPWNRRRRLVQPFGHSSTFSPLAVIVILGTFIVTVNPAGAKGRPDTRKPVLPPRKIDNSPHTPPAQPLRYLQVNHAPPPIAPRRTGVVPRAAA